MGDFSNLNTKIDIQALNEVIVFANQYRQQVEEQTTIIRTVCLQMEQEESLVGGDGDVIREAFKSIAEGTAKLEASVNYITKQLNTKLGSAIQMRKGTTVGDAQDAMKKANQNMGVLAKE